MFSAPKSEAGADAKRRPQGRKTQGEAEADVPRHRHQKTPVKGQGFCHFVMLFSIHLPTVSASFILCPAKL